jgi:hypothetical protein
LGSVNHWRQGLFSRGSPDNANAPALAALSTLPAPPPTPGDDFNRADSTNLGPQWTERSGDFKLASQTLRNATTAPHHVTTYTGGAYTNVAVSAEVQHASSNGSVLVGLRWGNYVAGVPRAGYAAELRPDGWVRLGRVSDGAQLGSYQLPGYAAGQWVRLTLRANGSSLSVEVNGVTRITASNSTFTSGEVGLWSYAPTAPDQHRFDNVTIQP